MIEISQLAPGIRYYNSALTFVKYCVYITKYSTVDSIKTDKKILRKESGFTRRPGNSRWISSV